MTQHFTKNTVEASFYCGKCSRFTQHRIDDGRKGPCLACIARYDLAHAEAKPAVEEIDAQQELLWEDVS